MRYCKDCGTLLNRKKVYRCPECAKKRKEESRIKTNEAAQKKNHQKRYDVLFTDSPFKDTLSEDEKWSIVDDVVNLRMRTNGLPYGLKKCNCCNEAKVYTEFPPCSPKANLMYGVSTTCSECTEKQRGETIQKSSYRREQRILKDQQRSIRVCKECGQEKSKDLFTKHTDLTREFGFLCFKDECKECTNRKARERWERAEEKSKIRKNERAKKWIKQKYHSNERFRIEQNLRGRFRTTFKDFLSGDVNISQKRKEFFEDLVGCSLEFMKDYLERYEYTTDMHIDHIVPLSRFDFTEPRVKFVAFHWMNTMPLTEYENTSKLDTLPDDWEKYIDGICKEIGEDPDFIKKFVSS